MSFPFLKESLFARRRIRVHVKAHPFRIILHSHLNIVRSLPSCTLISLLHKACSTSFKQTNFSLPLGLLMPTLTHRPFHHSSIIHPHHLSRPLQKTQIYSVQQFIHHPRSNSNVISLVFNAAMQYNYFISETIEIHLSSAFVPHVSVT